MAYTYIQVYEIHIKSARGYRQTLGHWLMGSLTVSHGEVICAWWTRAEVRVWVRGQLGHWCVFVGGGHCSHEYSPPTCPWYNVTNVHLHPYTETYQSGVNPS